MKVSVLIITYNHEKYLAKALESALMQGTNFEYEILVGEDCSTDNTKDILVEYQKKYPEMIKPFYRSRNIGMFLNFKDIFMKAKGEYIALLEGDDYWTDPFKLQNQVDFLNSNSQFSICFTNSIIVDADNNIIDKEKVPAEHQKNHTQREIISGFCPPLNTVMFRNGLIREFPKEFLEIINMDYFLYSLLTKFGLAGYLDENTAAYRRHAGGIWSQKSEEHKMQGYLKTCEALLEYFGEQYEDILSEHIKGTKKELERYKTTEESKDINIPSSEGNSMTDVINEAKELISKCNLEDAKDLCYEILSEETFCDDAYFLLGEINYASADYELALRNYQSAYEISKTRLDAAVKIVITYITLNRFPEAIKFLKKVIIENPYNQNLLLICRELKVSLEWEDLKDFSQIRLYAGDIPETEEYKNLVGLSIERNNHRHILHDMTKPLPLEDNSVDSFQSEDVFEHIAYEKLPAVIDEIFRVLKPGAVFRLSVPDYGCDILYNRSIKGADGKITFDPEGGGTIENPGHVWFPNISNVREIIAKTKFALSGKIDFLHYYNQDGTFQLKQIDYSKGFVKRNPDNDKRVQNPRRPMSLIVDLIKDQITCNQVDENINSIPYSIEKNNKNFVPELSFVMIVLNGMPFIEFSLQSVYDFAHEIIIVEGAVEKCLFAANEDGSSKDGTVEFIRNFPDPDKKIRLIQGIWPEKVDMQNKALEYVSGNYVWLIDSDEVYKKKDIEAIIKLLKEDPSITQINFIPDSFWKNFNYIFFTPLYFDKTNHFRRIFKFERGAKFTTHRPPTMVLPGQIKSNEDINLVDGSITRAMGIYFYHYSYVLDEQVKQKIDLYNRYGWGNDWNLDMNKWYEEGFLKWTPENRLEIEKIYAPWTGSKDSRTLMFTGEHPEVIRKFIDQYSEISPIGYKKYYNENQDNAVNDLTFQINFDLTDGCNLNCIMCGNVPNKNFKTQQVMGETIFKERFVKVFKYAKVFQFGCFFEPLMVPYFEDAVWAIKPELRSGVKGTIISNGMMLTQPKIEAIVDSDIFSKIRFSIDSVSDELFAKIRSGAKLKKLLDHIKQLVEYRNLKGSKSQVEVNFTIMRQNVHELPQLVSLAKDYNIDSITTHKLAPDDIAFVDPDYYKAATENVNLAAQLAKEKGILFSGQVFYTKENYLATSRNEIKRECNFNKRKFLLLTIDCNGNITHQCKITDKKLGSLFENSIEEILVNAPFKKLSWSVKNPQANICSDCCYFV